MYKGTGKTLLFNNISERLIKEVPKHLHIHHCKEFEAHELAETVLDTVVNGFPYRRILVACEAKIRELLAADPAPAGDVKAKLEDNLEFIVMGMKSIRGYEAHERASKMLRVLGFDDMGMKKLVSALSGGLRMRVALCLAFFIEADLLLLDEPTNHLDFPSVLWLENRLRGYKGSFVMVSHDRELLNNVCQTVMLLEDKLIKYYNMGFKEFEKKKAEEDKKKCDDIEKFLKRNPNADPSTPLGKEKAEKKEWQEAYNRKQVALAGKFTFPVSVPLDNNEVGADGQPVAADDISLIDLRNVRFSYNPEAGHFIFNDPISFRVSATTRVGVMGPNGAGKSTLLKLLTHKLTPTEGVVNHHPKFNLAYFGQHSTAELNLEMTPIEFMQSQFPEEKAGNLRSHLQKTSIAGPVADTRIKSLSFSQRSCVIFAKLTYIAPHLLILDEPTNFLDLESVDALIMACNKYKGALLLVSHNRDFLRKCAKQYLSVVPGQFKLFDRLKEAENATYSFIAEMEEGVKVGAGDLVKNNPGGGSVHPSQKTDSEEKKESGPKVITFGGAGATAPLPKVNASATPLPVPAKTATVTPATTASAPASAASFVADEKVQAQWKDGKWYAAVIKKVNAKDFTVLYTEYGNTANLPADKVRKLAAAPQPAKKQ
jgi:ATP-binding cassette subfamily F protein 3